MIWSAKFKLFYYRNVIFLSKYESIVKGNDGGERKYDVRFQSSPHIKTNDVLKPTSS